MKKFLPLLFGIVFFSGAVAWIAGSRSSMLLFPSREVTAGDSTAYGPVIKDFIFVQEITLKKRYLNQIDLFLANVPGKLSSENVLLLLTNDYRIAYTRKFSSDEIEKPDYHSFSFPKPLDIGNGKKIYLCLYSTDGDANNYMVLPREKKSGQPDLYVIPIRNNDVMRTIEQKQKIIPFPGSMCFRTYESASLIFTPIKWLLYALALLVSALLVFFKRLKTFILHFVIRPEWTWLILSPVFGLLFVFITPPFQAPDEPAHFYRTWQITEGNVLKYNDDIPRPLIQFAGFCERLKFKPWRKTNRQEILTTNAIKLGPTPRAHIVSPDYVIPYLPQALGVAFGRVFSLNPLSLFYLGRILNLISVILLLYFTIRTVPVFKWMFFLLGVMPMTLYLASSFSYDAVTLGLSFLLTAVILNLALNPVKTIRNRDLILVFVISSLLALCKPPYFIIAFSFLIIPKQKFSSGKKYWLIFAGLIFMVFGSSQLWTVSRTLFRPLHKELQTHAIIHKNTGSFMVPAGKKTIALSGKTIQPSPSPVVFPPEPSPLPRQESPYNPRAQKKFILDDLPRYAGILVQSVFTNADLYCLSFVGLFGWVDTLMPHFFIYLYLLTLCWVALSGGERGIRIKAWKKGWLLLIFVSGSILIITALYVYCNPVGCSPIAAVQGRYFIALSPLLFLLFYNSRISGSLNRWLDGQKKVMTSPPPYPALLAWSLIIFSLISTAVAFYTIITRFYAVAG
ncbi:MAG: DUF2142 domain-containing protein [Bacteroidales bacterium]|nr:DUF2142 domain-containing protein [Bacteroidales bacterium]